MLISSLFIIITCDNAHLPDMNRMFYGATVYNQPLDSWVTSSVYYMNQMFHTNDEFNQPLDSWNTVSVISMTGMFEFAIKFNQPIQSWDVSSVTDMRSMFAGASAFDQNLCDWKDAPAVTSSGMTNAMFAGSQGGPSIGIFKRFDATQCVSVVNKYDKFI